MSSFPSFSTIFFLSLGASLGAIARVFIYQWILRYSDTTLWATAIVNLLGSFLIGCLWVVLSHYQSPKLNFLFITGLLGSFTTFSTLSLDLLKLVQNSQLLIAISNISIQVILGISFCYLGAKITAKITSIPF